MIRNGTSKPVAVVLENEQLIVLTIDRYFDKVQDAVDYARSVGFEPEVITKKMVDEARESLAKQDQG